MKILVNTKLSEHKYKTPEGYLYCQDAIICRTGKQKYLKSELFEDIDENEDTIIEVDRPEEEVCNPTTIASFEDKPITCEHPDDNVGPDNYSELAVGHTKNVRKGPNKVNGETVLIADLLITDPSCIEDIENGKRTDLSCGYDCDITEGQNPKQINIRGNHVALCKEGRAGCARIIDSKPKNDNLYINTISRLIKEEEDAIKSYEDAIEESKEFGLSENVDLYKHIQDEEKEHLQELNQLYNKQIILKKDSSTKVVDSKLDDFYNSIFNYFEKDYDIEVDIRRIQNSNSDENDAYILIHDKKGKLKFDELKKLAKEIASKTGVNIYHFGSEHSWYINNRKIPISYTIYYEEDKTHKITDSKINDSVVKGSLIQEFGKQADQYKIVKIDGNTIYATELITGKIILFKKDKQGQDWDVITKSEVRDSNIVEKKKLNIYKIDNKKSIQDTDYSKRFYLKNIRELKKKLEELEKDEVKDSKNDDNDYKKQKNKMKKVIKTQISEYMNKLKDLDKEV